MKPELNKKYLITTNDWFTAPAGEVYKSAFGTVTAIDSDQDTLGIKPIDLQQTGTSQSAI